MFLGDNSDVLKKLLTEVTQKTNQWQSIALELDIDLVLIERFSRECRENAQDCFLKVFEQWHRQGNPPYSWYTIIKALESETVSERNLAQKLREKYSLTHHTIV